MADAELRALTENEVDVASFQFALTLINLPEEAIDTQFLHTWTDNNASTVYIGVVVETEEVRKGKRLTQVFNIGYHLESEGAEEGEDYEMPVEQLIADIMMGDLTVVEV